MIGHAGKPSQRPGALARPARMSVHIPAVQSGNPDSGGLDSSRREQVT
jgi:hypothetical protein